MSTYATVQAITDRLIRLSGQVPGTGVQVYATDIFTDMINTAVRMVARKYWWPHLMDNFSVAVDGTTGVPTSDLTGIKDHTDIKSIFANNSSYPLPFVSNNENRNRYTGTSALAYEALPITNALYLTRIIRVLPYTATDALLIRARIVPDTLRPIDTVPLDQDMIMFGVLWSYFEDEGDNPQQAGKYKGLFDSKFTEIISNIATHRVPIDGASYSSQDGYQYV